jgi:hypothetical protein
VGLVVEVDDLVAAGKIVAMRLNLSSDVGTVRGKR